VLLTVYPMSGSAPKVAKDRNMMKPSLMVSSCSGGSCSSECVRKKASSRRVRTNVDMNKSLHIQECV
jgi:hypothetical protein